MTANADLWPPLAGTPTITYTDTQTWTRTKTDSIFIRKWQISVPLKYSTSFFSQKRCNKECYHSPSGELKERQRSLWEHIRCKMVACSFTSISATTVVLHLWVMIPLQVTYQISCKSDICIMIHKSIKITVIKQP